METNSTSSPSGITLTMASMSVGVVLVALAIFAGNMLVIASVLLNRRLQTRTSAFITSLAISDLLIALLVVPLIIISNVFGPNMPSHQGMEYCHATISVAVSLMFNAVANLGAVSLDRYLAIIKPLRYKVIMRRRVMTAIIASIWIFSSFFGFVPYLGWREVVKRTKGIYCQVSLNLKREYIVTICVLATIPSIFMLIAYYKIFRTARMHAIRITAAVNSIMVNYSDCGVTISTLMKETKATKMVALVLGSFIVFWTPLFVIMIIDIVKENYVNSYIYAGSVMFATLNSALNPAIYAAMNKEFRGTFVCLLRCQMPARIAPAVPH